MPSLDDIKQAIQKKITSGQTLSLVAADISFSDVLTSFFKTLPNQTLNLQGAAISPATSGPSFQVTGNLKDTWTIPGVSNGNLADVALEFTISQASSTAPIVGALQVTQAQLPLTSQTPVALTGSVNGSSQLVLQNVASATRYGLDDVYSYFGQTDWASDLFLKAFGTFAISKLNLTALLGAAGTTNFSIQTAQDVQFQLLPSPAIQLNAIGVNLQFKFAASSNKGESTSSFSSTFTATTTIVSQYAVSLFQIKPGLWQMQIVPASGQLLPAVGDFAGWVGGDTLKNLIQGGLSFLHIDAVTVQSVQLVVDANGKQLQSATVNGSITVAGFAVAIQLKFPAGDFSLTYPPPTKQLKAPAAAAAGTLAIDDLINQLFGVSTGFPHIAIDECSITASPSKQTYQAQISTTEDWSFTVAGTKAFVFQTAVFAINATPQNKVFTMTCALALCGADFLVTGTRSSQPQQATWQFALTLNKSQIELSAFLNAFLAWLGAPTLPCPTLAITTLEIDYDSSTSIFNFKGAVDGSASTGSDSLLKSLEANLQLTRSPQQGVSGTLAGTLVIGKAQLQATYQFGKTNSQFEILLGPQTGTTFSFNDLLAALGISVTVPDELNLTITQLSLQYNITTHEAIISVQTQSGRSASWVSSIGADGTRGANFCIQVGTLSFSGLPLVGDSFPYQLDSFTLLVCTKPTTAQELAKLQGLPPMDSKVQRVGAGAYCLGALKSSDDNYPLMFPIYEVTPPPAGGALMVTAAAAPSTGSMTATNTPSFIQIQRTIGPIYIGQIGFEYQNQTVGILLNVALVASALEINLTGLYFGYSIPTKAISVNLNGLTIRFSNGPVTVSGGFFRNPNPVAPVTQEFSGEALIQAATFTLSALGSYAKILQDDGSEATSLFIFALLNKPLGGPPFFFVTGVSAGFGFNRDFILPTLDQLPTFPLIQGATQPDGGPFAGKTGPNDALSVLAAFVPPRAGQNWVVAGVQFTSFEQIHTVALLSVIFGTKFQIALLGRSTISVPAETDSPIAYAEMVMRAFFDPGEGVLAVSAQLTSESYILSKSCKLTGGFAFYNWFSGPNEGQFVVTLGGYSPFFSPPSFYPTVPRVGINWDVNGNLTVKGQAYYAITPSCLMAGGYLEASYEAGPVSAWFNASADFLIAWKPFHYFARISVSIGVSARISLVFTSFTLSAHVGATLTLWGPSFAGSAHIDLSVISFTISFGDSDPNPNPIEWSEFKTSFLPANEEQYLSANVTEGLSRTVRKSTDPAKRALKRTALADPAPADVDWFLTPEQVTLNVQSVVPILTVGYNGAPVANGSVPNSDPSKNPTWSAQFGVGPVGVAVGSTTLTSDYQITLTREGAPYPLSELTLIPILKNLPKGMWGALAPNINDPNQTVSQVLVGFQITGPLATPGILRPISLEKLESQTQGSMNFTWQSVTVPTTDPYPRDPDAVLTLITNTFQQTGINSRRKTMASAMAAFGLDVNAAIAINPTGLGSAGLIQAPQLRVLGEISS
jgi:hypothetical protein